MKKNQVIKTFEQLLKATPHQPDKIVVSPQFTGWDDSKPDCYYSFTLHPDYEVGVSTHLYHPGKASLPLTEKLQDLYDWIIAGHDIEFRLNTKSQSAVRFTELFIAGITREYQAHNVCESSFAERLVRNEDTSVCGYSNGQLLMTPCVVGYTEELRPNDEIAKDCKAPIWSYFWQLSDDPLAELYKTIHDHLKKELTPKTPSDPTTVCATLSHLLLVPRPISPANQTGNNTYQ